MVAATGERLLLSTDWRRGAGVAGLADRQGDRRGARHRGRNPGLDNVAALAGVSPATVSRVINQPELVRPDTRRRVSDAIARLGYVPNRIAGSLASNRTGLIALIVPSLVQSVFNDTIQAMTESLTAAGFQVLLGLSGYNPGDLGMALDSLLSRRPDGIIVTGFAGNPVNRKRLLAARIPVIETWDVPRRPLDMVVGFSHAQAGRDTADFAAARGHRRVCLVTADSARAQQRRDAFRQRYAELGLPEPEQINVPFPSTVAHGRQAFSVRAAHTRLPELFVCSSDWLALGVQQEAQHRRLRVPTDIAVMGFGDLDFSADLEPALTTIHVDGVMIGRESARMLLASARGARPKQRVIDVGIRIVERGSTRPGRATAP